MMKVQSSLGNYFERPAPREGASPPPDKDIAFLSDLIDRTILPRQYSIVKGTNRLEIIAKNKQLIGFRSPSESDSSSIIPVDANASNISAQKKSVREMFAAFGPLAHDDVLTIKRVEAKDISNLPDVGIQLSEIDFLAADSDEPKGGYTRKLRVVVDNQRVAETKMSVAQNISEPEWEQKPEPLARADTTPVTPAPAPSDSITQKYYQNLCRHGMYVVIKDRAGNTLKEHGVPGAADAALSEALVSDLARWEIATSNVLTLNPKLLLNVGETISLVTVISSDHVVIGEVRSSKIGKVLMDWKATSNNI